MKIIATVFFAVLSLSVQAEQSGRLHYSMPQNSYFELKKEDNGLYIQFSGNASISGKIAVVRYSEKEFGLYLLPNNEHLEKMPFKEHRHNAYLPVKVQLLHSNQKALEIINENELAINKEDMLIIGEGAVVMSDYNIGGDCGIPAFFTFNYKLQNLNVNKVKVVKKVAPC